MFEQEPKIISLQKGKNVIYKLYWSHLMETDKYTVAQKVPSVSGIYELYYEDKEKRLNLLTVAPAWLGGLRSQIRDDIEPDGKKSAELRYVLDNYKLYSRYTTCDIKDDIQDVLWYLCEYYFKDKNYVEASPRYDEIAVKEFAPDCVHWV